MSRNVYEYFADKRFCRRGGWRGPVATSDSKSNADSAKELVLSVANAKSKFGPVTDGFWESFMGRLLQPAAGLPGD